MSYEFKMKGHGNGRKSRLYKKPCKLKMKSGWQKQKLRNLL